jgi:hypothetical protein
MKFSYALPAAIAALALGASFAFAGDNDTGAGAPTEKVKGTAKPRVLVFGDGAARFDVVRDPTAGRMTFRLADPAQKLERAPVVVMTTDAGPREVVLTAVDGQPGVWVWTNDAVRTDRFDGTMRVVVAGKTYTSPLATVWTVEDAAGGAVVYKARYGGRVLALSDCGASVEVVQDLATGTLTIYSFEDVVIAEAPAVVFMQSEGETVVTLTKVEGKDGAWFVKKELFRTPTTSSARIRLVVNGKPCEAALVYTSSHGGRMVPVTGGPSFEVVRDEKSGHYTFYPVEETWNGKAYTVENPTVVMNGRTYNLTRVEGEPRAWRLVGLDAAGSDARDGQLNFTLFGKTLSTRLGLSGFGVGVK